MVINEEKNQQRMVRVAQQNDTDGKETKKYANGLLAQAKRAKITQGQHIQHQGGVKEPRETAQKKEKGQHASTKVRQ